MRTSLLVFAKEPLPGRVKTRLTPPLSPVQASELAAAFLADLLDRLDALPGVQVTVALPPDASRERMASRFGTGRRWVDQGEGDLGERLVRAAGGEFRAGANGVLVVGSDHPNLPLSALEGCLGSVAAGRFAWILAEDGGYAALGMPRFEPRLFENIPWSTSGVSDATRARAREIGVEIDTWGTWYDVDRSEDLGRLLRDLETSGGCPSTYALLAAWRTAIEGRGIVPDGRDREGRFS